jgi:hypothetical protein
MPALHNIHCDNLVMEMFNVHIKELLSLSANGGIELRRVKSGKAQFSKN